MWALLLTRLILMTVAVAWTDMRMALLGTSGRRLGWRSYSVVVFGALLYPLFLACGLNGRLVGGSLVVRIVWTVGLVVVCVSVPVVVISKWILSNRAAAIGSLRRRCGRNGCGWRG